MRPMLFIRDAENLNGTPIIASSDPVLLAAVGRLIAKHLDGTEAPATPRPGLRAVKRESKEELEKPKL